jgi:type II secretory ATPase GspE/PulE/Tfp pilus assembly ATPase PilB-like protein
MTQIEHQEDQSQNVVIRLLTNLIRLAVLNNASDVHIEPDQDKVRVRFRIDGVLREVESHPMSVLDPLASRIKVLADLNLAERRRPKIRARAFLGKT